MRRFLARFEHLKCKLVFHSLCNFADPSPCLRSNHRDATDASASCSCHRSWQPTTPSPRSWAPWHRCQTYCAGRIHRRTRWCQIWSTDGWASWCPDTGVDLLNPQHTCLCDPSDARHKTCSKIYNHKLFHNLIFSHKLVPWWLCNRSKPCGNSASVWWARWPCGAHWCPWHPDCDACPSQL